MLFNLNNIHLVLIAVAVITVVFNETLLSISYYNTLNTLLENNVVFIIVICLLIYYYTIDPISALILAFIFVYIITYKEKVKSINNVVETLEAFGI